MEKPVKILIAKPGLDGHDRGAKVIAQALRDAGMEVIYSGLHKTVEQILEMAIEEDVQVIGLSIMTGAHIPITKKVIEKMRERGIEDKLVFVGGVIPAKDIPVLMEMGVAGVFPGGVSLRETIKAIKEKVSVR
ncbi:MAG: cobalamin B12-binding domain-containing protein [Syntrophorhabdaceae bacterium]|nr:cobalamin B12-binding domain-containing protein [Syntrophorhabdaceae bacterium]